MRRGMLAQQAMLLQRAFSFPTPAPSCLVAQSYDRRHFHRRPHYYKKILSNSRLGPPPTCTIVRCNSASLIASLSWRQDWIGNRVSSFSRGLVVWRSTKWCPGSSSCRGLGSHQGSQGRVELPVMAAWAEVPEGYRPNVGLCLVNEKDEVFVASRLDVPDSWQMPQGGVDDGEEPRNAAIRELREETGVTTVQLIGEVQEWLTYDFPSDVKAKIGRLWGKEWNGQAQKWFLFRFTGDESEINLAGDGSEDPEFGDWKWLAAEEVLQRAVEFKKPVYTQAFKSLAVHIHSWSKL